MLHNIQTLRVIFALLVITGHLEVLYTHMGLVDPSNTIDGGANDGLLIVSAFVIIYSGLRKPGLARDFAGRRLARLVPFYWVITLVVAGLCLIAPTLFQATRVTPETLAKSLLFIPYLKHDDVIAPIVFVGWTMNYIVVFLLLHALNIALFGQRAWIATAGVLATLAAYGVIAQPTDVIAKFFTGPRQISFALGAMLAGLWHTHPIRAKTPGGLSFRSIAVGLIIAGLAVRIGQQIWLPELDKRFVGPFASCGVVIGALLLESNRDIHRGAIRDKLAEASFAIYLTHIFVTQLVQKSVSVLDIYNVPLLIALAIVAYVASLILGVFVCTRIEKPLDKLVRNGWRKLTERPSVPEEASVNR